MFSYLNLCVMVIMMNPSVIASSDCEIEWNVDWSMSPPASNFEQLLENPEKLIRGPFVRDMFEVLGLAWNAKSWHEIAGLVCVRFGPLMNSIVDGNVVRCECDAIVASLREETEFHIFSQCNSILKTTGIWLALDEYTAFLCQYIFAAHLNNSQCNMETISPILLDILEWIGPSSLSYNPSHVLCSGLRRLLETPPNDILEKIKMIFAYPTALSLQTVRPDDEDMVHLIRASSNPSDEDFVRLLVRNSPFEEFYDRALTILDNIHLAFTNKNICMRLLNASDESFNEMFHDGFHQIFGFNLSSPESREHMCTNTSLWYGIGSFSFVPSSYSIPHETKLSIRNLFEGNPGELLPGFFYEDAARGLGAFLQSGTLIEGLELMCPVFEPFLDENLPYYYPFNRTYACEALLQEDGKAIESTCILLTYSKWYRSLGPRTADSYVAFVVLKIARELFNLERVTERHICDAIDEYFHSQNNFQSLIRTSLNSLIFEFLPKNPKYFCDYYNPNEISYDSEQRDMELEFLAYFGYSNTSEICEDISDGINSLSGTASSDIVDIFQRRLLMFTEDINACRESLPAIFSFLELTTGLGDLDPLFFNYTDYSSIDDICEDFKLFFAANLCPYKPEVSDIDLQLFTSSYNDSYAYIVAMWSYNTTGHNVVSSQHISFQPLEQDDCVYPSDPTSLGHERELPGHKRSYRARPMRHNLRYNVTLILRTENGLYRKVKEIRTNSAKPTGPPINVRATEKRKEGVLVFRWHNPECTLRNGQITGFDFTFSRSSRQYSVCGSTDQRKIKFQWLSTGESYSFEVKAATEKGTGPAAVYKDRF